MWSRVPSYEPRSRSDQRSSDPIIRVVERCNDLDKHGGIAGVEPKPVQQSHHSSQRSFAGCSSVRTGPCLSANFQLLAEKPQGVELRRPLGQPAKLSTKALAQD